VTLAVSVREAAEVAQAVTGESLERFVAELPAEAVPTYLARLTDAATNIRALTKGLEQRLVADEQVGQHWMIDGVEYGFFGSVQKGYRDIPGLFAYLISLGISAVSLASSVSEARVTDLRAIADTLPPEKRQEALNEIEDHRVAKGERGSPRFQAITEYVKK